VSEKRKCKDDEHEYQCYKCGEPQAHYWLHSTSEMVEQRRRGQRALELLRKIANDYYLTLDGVILGEIEALLKGADNE
jgi:hypothetical protein